jgi:hypothetical protein
MTCAAHEQNGQIPATGAYALPEIAPNGEPISEAVKFKNIYISCGVKET